MPVSERLRFAFGLEFETSIWRHGGNIGSDTIQLVPFTTDSAARMAFLLHVRFELKGLL